MDENTSIGRAGVEATVIKALTWFLLLLLLLPIAMVLAMSFTSVTTLQFPPPELSLRWYADVWSMVSDEQNDFTRLRESFETSFVIAAATSLVCLVAGVPASYALVRFRFLGHRVVEELLLSVPIIFPTVVLGVALLVIVSMSGLDLGIFQIVVAHSIIGLPFMMRNCVAALHGIDPSLQEAAKTLGASSIRAFTEIILPLIRGGMSSGVLLVFILSFNEFTLSYFLYTIDVFPLSIWLFQQSNTSFSPAIFAVSSLMIVINIAVILIVDKAFGTQKAAR
ncbi:ABC transporter permease [Pelagibius litoralis]|uniref:ABC transporter permease n=1 Tax=Pelagibius litoralis TaxID=374515 RepID=A0A967EXV2_9PROT|nr:ABC transporter permease [Pelagibius litoralis]NIA69380.1 ABC transporter permease [Pelagibius litoralis]